MQNMKTLIVRCRIIWIILLTCNSGCPRRHRRDHWSVAIKENKVNTTWHAGLISLPYDWPRPGLINAKRATAVEAQIWFSPILGACVRVPLAEPIDEGKVSQF